MTVWKGGDHRFELRIGEFRALQSATGVGPLFLLGRIAGSQWFVDDIIETVRLGLIGGGVDDQAAKKLVDKVLVDNPTEIFKHAPLALFIIKTSLMGDDNDPVGEDDQGEQNAGSVTNSVA
ncbi:gene transfer agent family protein [Rhizobium leguminosarum]|uniref:gene transfer agent family protein n=1 Tax=Rhizobium leguminosarum TaxID=384 RepID=UPI001441FF5B|nr:gene transfer agent family protein [Rhizobium leguminosarum]MBY5863265.1 gene transfer agent family protein [Rhizobium leguminosarum]NKM04145.1 hypothetical protein [Rhizobium leguminosarum bv. viciae]